MDYCVYCMAKTGENDTVCPVCGKSLQYECPVHHLLPGTLLNHKFMVGAAIGEGGFGITYIGRDINLDIKVAIKEYYPNGYANRNNTSSAGVTEPRTNDRKAFFDKGRKSFLNEARALAKFSGESGIVDVRDFFEENNTAYIVMEYLDGKTLKDYLKDNGALPYDRVIELLLPLMRSLKKVHEQGVIHRDISPDNIMLSGDRAKLLDFGAARTISAEANKSLSVLLKPGYAPEEQYRSRGKQGPWTDIYALCATIYKCITGITPDDSTERLVNDELKKPSALGIRIDPDAEAALMKGLSVAAVQRYQNVQDLIDGLTGCGGDQKTVPAVPSAPHVNNRQVEADDEKTVFSPVSESPVKEPEKTAPTAKEPETPVKDQEASKEVSPQKEQPATDEKKGKKKKRKGLIIALIVAVVLIAAGVIGFEIISSLTRNDDVVLPYNFTQEDYNYTGDPNDIEEGTEPVNSDPIPAEEIFGFTIFNESYCFPTLSDFLDNGWVYQGDIDLYALGAPGIGYSGILMKDSVYIDFNVFLADDSLEICYYPINWFSIHGVDGALEAAGFTTFRGLTFPFTETDVLSLHGEDWLTTSIVSTGEKVYSYLFTSDDLSAFPAEFTNASITFFISDSPSDSSVEYNLTV